MDDRVEPTARALERHARMNHPGTFGGGWTPNGNDTFWTGLALAALAIVRADELFDERPGPVGGEAPALGRDLPSLTERPGYNANPNDWVRYANWLESRGEAGLTREQLEALIDKAIVQLETAFKTQWRSGRRPKNDAGWMEFACALDTLRDAQRYRDEPERAGT